MNGTRERLTIGGTEPASSDESLNHELEFLWQDRGRSGKAYDVYLGRISRNPVVRSRVTGKYFMLPWSQIIELAVQKGIDAKANPLGNRENQRPRNNRGSWYSGYAGINWHRPGCDPVELRWRGIKEKKVPLILPHKAGPSADPEVETGPELHANPCWGWESTNKLRVKYQLSMSRVSSITGEKEAEQIEGIRNGLHPSLPQTRDFLEILAKSQAASQAYVKAEEALATGHLTREQRKQIALLVAAINDSDHCLLIHSASARNCGLSEEDIRLARKATAVDPKTDAMLRFTLLVTAQRGDIKREDLRALLKAGFSEGEAMEIVANIALNIFANYLNVVFRNEAGCPVPEAKAA